MKKYIMMISVLFFILIVFYIIVEIFHVPFLADARFNLLAKQHSWWAGIALLTIDVLVPVPSSLVMITLGSTSGIGFGTLWGFAGIMGASVAGFLIGRKAKTFLVRFVPVTEQQRMNALISRWGMLCIIVTRPLPLLAETTILIAGSTTLSWRKLLAASIIGNLPIAFFYAYVGATATSKRGSIWAFVMVVAAATLFWGVNIMLDRHTHKR